MKKSVIVLTSLAATMIVTAAFAAPVDKKGPRPGRHEKGGRGPHIEQKKRSNLNIPETAPDEIKAMYKEFYSINHDLRLELNKENPDGVKALEMVHKAEDLHKSLRQWKVGQILEGKMPKPELTPRGGEAPAPQFPEAFEGEAMPMLGFGCMAPVPPCGPAPEAGVPFGAPCPDFRGPVPYGSAHEEGAPFDAHRPNFYGHAPEMNAPFHGPRPDFDGHAPEMNAPFHGPRPDFDGPAPEMDAPFHGPRPGFDGPAPEMNAPFHGPRPGFDGPAPEVEAPAPEKAAPAVPETEAGESGNTLKKLGQAVKDFTGSITERISGEEASPETANPDSGIMTLEEVAPEDKPAE